MAVGLVEILRVMLGVKCAGTVALPVGPLVGCLVVGGGDVGISEGGVVETVDAAVVGF